MYPDIKISVHRVKWNCEVYFPVCCFETYDWECSNDIRYHEQLPEYKNAKFTVPQSKTVSGFRANRPLQRAISDHVTLPLHFVVGWKHSISALPSTITSNPPRDHDSNSNSIVCNKHVKKYFSPNFTHVTLPLHYWRYRNSMVTNNRMRNATVTRRRKQLWSERFVSRSRGRRSWP